MKHPKYRVEKFKGGFIVTQREVRGFSFVYRNAGFGRFDSRETAEAVRKTATEQYVARLKVVA
jgi:hypothetical protein